jgi:hypothetical protein
MVGTTGTLVVCARNTINDDAIGDSERTLFGALPINIMNETKTNVKPQNERKL